MWVFLNDAMLSIVEPPNAGSKLLVRARIGGDIQRIFPHAEVQQLAHRDYRFRALVDRTEVASAMAAEVASIHYGNFKNSVADDARHDAYFGVLRVMFAEQERQAQLTQPRNTGKPKRAKNNKVNPLRVSAKALKADRKADAAYARSLLLV